MYRWLFNAFAWTGILFLGSVVALSFVSGFVAVKNPLGAPGETTIWYWVLLAGSVLVVGTTGLLLKVLQRSAIGEGRDEKADFPDHKAT